MLVQMISAGEETGKLDMVLERVSNYYDQEVETSLKTATSMIEPIMIAVMGSWSAASACRCCCRFSRSAAIRRDRGRNRLTRPSIFRIRQALFDHFRLTIFRKLLDRHFPRL